MAYCGSFTRPGALELCFLIIFQVLLDGVSDIGVSSHCSLFSLACQFYRWRDINFGLGQIPYAFYTMTIFSISAADMVELYATSNLGSLETPSPGSAYQKIQLVHIQADVLLTQLFLLIIVHNSAQRACIPLIISTHVSYVCPDAEQIIQSFISTTKKETKSNPKLHISSPYDP